MVAPDVSNRFNLEYNRSDWLCVAPFFRVFHEDRNPKLFGW
jgi:hypothetical protein